MPWVNSCLKFKEIPWKRSEIYKNGETENMNKIFVSIKWPHDNILFDVEK